VRWDRQDVAGVIQPERIPAWAHQRLQEMGISLKIRAEIGLFKNWYNKLASPSGADINGCVGDFYIF
jgi:hypothetical protein